MGTAPIDFSKLVVTVTALPPALPRPIRVTQFEVPCANCDQRFITASAHSKLYCSTACKAISKAVRAVRATRKRYPGPLPDDITYGNRIKVAFAVSGGYRDTARHRPKSTDRAVRDRDHDRCVLCGALGEQIDHIDGDSVDLANLRLLCGPCHREVTELHLRRVDDPDTIALLRHIQLRCLAPRPIRACDDEKTWRRTWRTWPMVHSQPVKS